MTRSNDGKRRGRRTVNLIKTSRLVGINLLVLLVLLAVVELTLGDWLFGPQFGALNVGFNTVRVEDDSPYYPVGTSVMYRRDEFGLRGDHGDPARITILAVGGSTTNDRAATEGDTWPDVLEQNLRAQGYDHVVANAGVDGHSTVGHIKAFELWFPNIPDLHPAYTLVYAGHNDRGVAPGEVPLPDSLTSPSWSKRFSNYIGSHSIIARTYRNLKGWIAAKRIGVTYGEVDTRAGDVTYVPVDYANLDLDELAQSIEAFGRRLEILNQMLLAFGTTPIFVTQPVGLVREAGRLEEVEGSGAGRIYLEMQRYNDRLLKFCREVGALCVDLAGNLSFEASDFYDAIHTTPSGSRKIGEYLGDNWPLVVE